MKKTIAILIIWFTTLGLQSQVEIKNLVFEGAGIRGLAYAGALEALEENGIIEGVDKVAGTSAGAIIALMISLGYTADEVREIISNTNFNDFNDGKNIFIGGLHRVKNNFGWYQTAKFNQWLENIIADKTNNPDIVFKEIEDLKFKQLYVTATCLNKQKSIVFSKEDYPQMKIKDAVTISMSVPVYFEAVFIDSLGAIHKKPKDLSHLDIVLDGGLLNNYPIDIFDRDSTLTDGSVIRVPNPHTLGFRIDSKAQIEKDMIDQGLAPIPIENMKEYMIAMYILIIENLNRSHLKEFDWARTVSIDDAAIGPKVKSLDITQKEALISSGKESMKIFLAKSIEK